MMWLGIIVAVTVIGLFLIAGHQPRERIRSGDTE